MGEGPEMESATSRRPSQQIDRLLDLSSDVMAVADLRSGEWLRVNASFEKSLGWTLEEAPALLSLVDASDRLRATSIFAALSEGKTQDPFTLRIRRRNNSSCDLDWRATASPSEGVIYFLGRPVSDPPLTGSSIAADQLRIAKQAAGLGIHSYDIATGTIQWDERVRELWGIGPDEIITYETFLDGLVEADRPSTKTAVDRALHPESDGRYYSEYRVTSRADGVTRWIAATGQVEFVDGQALRLTGTVQDVTDRKLAEIKVRESERQFRDTFENAAVGIAQVGLDGRWLRVNQRLCEIVGYTKAELLDTTFHAITHPDDVAGDWEQARRLIAGEIANYSMEKRYLRPDRSTVWVNLTVAMQYDEQGAPTNFISVVEDIHARKQAEEERERLMRELRASEDRLRAVMDQMPSGLYILGAPEGRIVASSREAEKILGHPPIADQTMQGYAAYGGVHENGTRYEAQEYPAARALLHGEVVRQEKMLYQRPNGELANLSVSAAPLKESATIVGAVCTFEDVTERTELETALRATKERLELALDANRLGTWTWDIPSGRVAWGGYSAPLFGLKEGEFDGRFETFLECLHPDDRGPVQRELARATSTGDTSYCQDYRTIWPDGTIHWLEGRARFFYAFDGRPLRMVGVVQDVTARKEAEAALEAAQRRLRLALDAAQAGTFDISLTPESSPVVTGGVKKLFGFDPESMPLTEEYLGRVHPDDRNTVQAAIQNSSETRQGHFVEYRIVRPAGDEVWVASRAEVIEGGDGNPPRLIGALIDITTRKLTEAALRESEARFRVALHAGSFGVWDWEPGSGDIHADPTVRRLFGFDESQATVALDQVLGTIHPGDREPVLAALDRGLEVGAYEAEFRVVLRDGTERWLAGFGELVRNSSGTPLRMIGINRDITQRKQSEEVLRRRELELSVERDRLARVFEQSPAFIAVLRGSDHIFELANAAYYQVVGHRSILGKPVFEALPELRGQGFEKVLSDVLRTGEPFLGTGVPVRLQTSPDGPMVDVYVDFVYAPMTEADGTRSGVVAIGYEVTQRVRAEQAQRALQEQLARNAAEFRQIADSLPHLVWVTRPDGHHEWFNRRWYEYTGAMLEMSSGEQWVNFFHPDDHREAQRRWAHSIATGEPYRVEYRCRRHDGVWRWFLGRAEPIRDDQGVILRWFGTCTDIHDQKRIQEELRSTNEELERFAYVAGHDLQEPLRAITSFSQLLARRYQGQLDTNADEFIQHITGASERMSRLIQDLLTYARSTGAGELNLRPTDCNTALSVAMENLNSRVEQTSALLTADPLPVVPAVDGLLVQVFQNLIGNALKYHRESVPPRVHVSAKRDGEFWIFSVQDNGQGIAPKHQQKLFQLFSRLHGREVSGSGIGLATVKRIVERHGGRVWLQSEPDAGSTFFFSLPESR
jgi:PAS domain S-box-containing protein